MGQPIPTYSQPIIEGFAHAYTGWTYAYASNGNFLRAQPLPANQVVPMQLYAAYHDVGPKLVLGGVTIPPNQTGAQDLDAALDNIFAHSNVGPFITQRLIQRLVTSNPSPAYVSRVAQRFNDNGRGVRGDLAAVVKAILLDAEARGPATAIDGQAQGAAAAPDAALARVQRPRGGRRLPRVFESERSPGARAVAGQLGIQLFRSRFRAGRRDPRT